MELTLLDVVAFVGFILFVVCFSMWVSRKEESADDYFLAGRKLTWWLIGISLIASNISTEHFVGMAGRGYELGLAIASYEWTAAVAMVLVAILGRDPAIAGFLTIWLAIWSIGCYALATKVVGAWSQTGATGSLLAAGGALFITLFSVPFFGGWLMGTWFLAESVSPTAALALGCILLTDMAFYDLLKAPTRLGRKVLDRLEGFELYLSVAEEDRMNFHNPPERTPELFEKILPYALALGVEQAWGERFAGVLAAAGRDPSRSDSGYRPRWYSGRSFHQRGISDFASNLGGSFAGAIASSSTAPGSSSGSGGGGSSGGGGGGGGGSGW